MTPPTERQSKSRKARRDAGLVPLTVWVPKDRAALFRELADKMAKQKPLRAGWRRVNLGFGYVDVPEDTVVSAERPCSYCGNGPCIATGQAVGIWPPPNCAEQAKR